MNKIFSSLLIIFITQSVCAEYIMNDIIDGCNIPTLHSANNTTNMIPVFTPTVYNCSSGQFVPANTDGCRSCPSGYTCPGGEMTFNETKLSGINYKSTISQSTQYTCSNNFLNADNNTTNMIPVFTPTVYNCSSGQFVPANTDGCRSCPSGYTCPGGEMTFSETKLSGINYKPTIMESTQQGCATNFLHTDNNNTTNMIPVFQPMEINCHPGYYLTANNTECSPCLIDNKCIGGTYTFNETTTQGIEPCPNGTYAPGGTAYCYEHILHVGDDVVYLKSDKLTTPSLNIGMNDGIFYANMTTEPTLMNKDSEHYLKLEFNNTVYYVCDDTTLR